MMYLLTPKYPGIERASELINKVGAVAIAPNIALTVHPFSEENYLVRGLRGFIGEFTKSDTLVVHYPAIFQEIFDTVKRRKLSIEVVCDEHY